jgi:hypothetical protein
MQSPVSRLALEARLVLEVTVGERELILSRSVGLRRLLSLSAPGNQF